ncbi:MAG: hypothetical protein GF364_21425 [Candidatus Lokiarchaeota archaeon]|nr:hypothetical protein [Candidatus Lokiarchaeota archaeon]
MKYILYRLLFGDPEGAEIFNKFKKNFASMKEIDEEYEGPNTYWCFHQLGKLGEIKLALIRWEIWSAWKEESDGLPGTDPLLPGYIGASAALFFYFIDIPDTWEILKEQIDRFWDRQKKELPVSLVVALYDSEKNTKSEIMKLDHVKKQMEYIKKKRGDVLFVPDKFTDGDVQKLFDGFAQFFIKKLDKEFAADYNLGKELKYLDLSNVRHLLIAERRGWDQQKLDDYLSAPEPVGKGEVWEMPPEEEIVVEEPGDSSPDSEPVGEVQTEAISIGEDEHVLVSPEGEEVKVKAPTEAELVEFDRKGYQIPTELKAIIPRYCPKCGNYNQRMIFERTDRNNILLDYPRIYGLKTVCGNCGCEWNQNTREILSKEDD